MEGRNVDGADESGLSETTRRELGSTMLWAFRFALAAVTALVVAFVVHALLG